MDALSKPTLDLPLGTWLVLILRDTLLQDAVRSWRGGDSEEKKIHPRRLCTTSPGYTLRLAGLATVAEQTSHVGSVLWRTKQREAVQLRARRERERERVTCIP